MHPNYQYKRINKQMENKNQLFSTVEPSENLKVSIIKEIKKREIIRAVYKIAFSSAVSLTSVSVAIIFVVNVVKDFYQSGLYEYISLMFSDGTSLISYWQTYLISVAESLPIIQITVVLASILSFIWSLNIVLPALKDTRRIFYHKGGLLMV